MTTTDDQVGRGTSPYARALRRFSRNHLAVFGGVIAALMLLAAVLAPILAPYQYDKPDLGAALRFPSFQHPLGTDALGRDLLSRLIWGCRTSLGVAFAVQAISLTIGVTLGTAAGTLGDKVDFFVSRLVEFITAFPGFLFTLFLMTLLGNGIGNLIFALSITRWRQYCRLARGMAFALAERDFVMAARSFGAKDRHIILRCILPNVMPTIIVSLSLAIPNTIFAEAGLSYLGLGINEPTPSWGKMVADSNNYIRYYWYLGLFPTLAIAIATLSFSFLAHGLRDAFDPTVEN